MTKNDFERFSKIMIATAEAQDKSLTPQRIALYFDDLLDLDVRAIEYAMREHRRRSPHFPRVSEIRDIAKTMPKPPAPRLEHKPVWADQETAKRYLDEINKRLAAAGEE